MNLDYAVCPHCSCHCEEDDYCPGCGRLFDENIVPTPNISLLELLRSGLRSVKNSFYLDNKFPDVDASDDPGLAHLPGNSYHHIWLHKQK